MIRYDKKLNKEINRIVNNYNAKINRLKNKKDLYELPTKIYKSDINEIKKSVSNRKELRRRLDELKRFSKKGGEEYVTFKGGKIPRYKYETIKSYRRLLKFQTTRKLKRYEETHPRSGLKEEPFTFSQYGSQEYLNLQAKRARLLGVDIFKLNSKELDEYLTKLQKNTKNVNVLEWQNNFIDILQDTAISYLWNDEKLDDLVTKLRTLSPREFDDLYFRDKNLKAIVFYYQALLDIGNQQDLDTLGEDVRANLDEFYDNLNDIIESFKL